MLLSAHKPNKDADFIFLKDLVPVYAAKCTSTFFDLGITVLD